MDCSSKILRICVCIVHSVHCQSHTFRSWCPTLTRSRSRSLETFKGRSQSQSRSPTRKWGLRIPDVERESKIAGRSKLVTIIINCFWLKSCVRWAAGHGRVNWQLETCAGRQMCSLTHPSTVKNFPYPHSPLTNSSLTHTHPAQSFPSPALIPRNHHTFPQFPANFFICRPIYFRLLHSLSNIIC